MGEIEAGLNTNVFFLIAATVITCVILHFLFKSIFGSKKKEAALEREPESNQNAPVKEAAPKTAVIEARTGGKNKKRTEKWKGKTDFSHPWLLKNLKGHPGTVMLVDFSSNGKFMAAACDDSSASVADSASAASRRRKPRDRRRSPATPPPRPSQPPPPQRLPAEELAVLLRPHLLTTKCMWALGYPLDLDPTSETPKAVVYITPPRRPKVQFTAFDVNAPEFVPGGSLSDSGQGSLDASPRSESDEETDTVVHLCVRCDKRFKMTRDSEYVGDSQCVYHWGRLNPDSRYACCNKVAGEIGCLSVRFHVWNGTYPGMNGPLDGYVRTHKRRGGVLAMDAEMCYTTAGLELASVAIVAADGKTLYHELVKPSAPLVDANTRFSGIKKRDLLRAEKTLSQVQKEVLELVGADTILIGHSLDNDLRVLKILHGLVVDTCAMYPHIKGFPARRSLRVLCYEVLKRVVQCGEHGHSPVEDATEALNLVLQKVQEERKARVRMSNRMSMLQPYDPLICAA